MSTDFVIDTQGLTQRYGRKLALDNLDLRIPRGNVHAIVGANGAGKSTLFRVLLGFQSATAGTARILGHDSRALAPEVRGRIGFVNEEHTLPGWLTVAGITAMQRRHYRRWNPQAFEAVIGHYQVLSEQSISQLSRGERAGLNLALSLAQSPELLILDEPTLGLDVVAKRAFLESLLYSNATDQCTVIYCSHQMDEIERVADNLIILERGRLKLMAAPEEFCARVSLWVADIPFRGPAPERIPGLLQAQQIEGLQHYLVLDQDASFGDFLRREGARKVQNMPVSLDRAVNAMLAQHHATPSRKQEPAHA